MSRPPSLSVVADNDLQTPDDPAPTETVGARVRALQAEARALAHTQAQALSAALVDLHAMAAEIHGGGDAFQPGVRALARDVMQATESHGLILTALLGRAS